MRTLVDTSSLVSLARYYHPFDSTEVLNEFLNSEIASGDIIVLDKIAEEVQYVSGGMAVEAFPCLKDKKIMVSTKEIIPKQKFFNMLDNSFVDNAVKRLKFRDDDDRCVCGGALPVETDVETARGSGFQSRCDSYCVGILIIARKQLQSIGTRVHIPIIIGQGGRCGIIPIHQLVPGRRISTITLKILTIGNWLNLRKSYDRTT